jgi:Pro-kumamolisin, activation domain/Abnormal spindle-like microcephaly-assoc'd, ASPM-SPD-2-Hydin
VNRSLIIFSLTLVAIVSSVNADCQAQARPLLTRHVREATLNGQAQLVGRLPASQSMHFDIVMALSHPAELKSFLQELYNPSSPQYRHFVTVPQFTERFGPSQQDFDALIAFAKANGLEVVGGSRDAMDVQFEGSVAAVEKAFHVAMGVYQHPTENRTFYAPDREPTVDLPFQLWHISGLDNYSIPRPGLTHKPALQPKPEATTGSCPDQSFCGSDMRAAYYGSGPLDGTGQTLGLLEFNGYDIVDLQTYFSNIGQTNNVPVIGVAIGNAQLLCTEPDCDDTEPILDMTQAISMAPGMSGLYVFVGTTGTSMVSAMSTHQPLSSQLSSSWTWSPVDPQVEDPYFMKFAAQGQSFFEITGDDGAYRATGASTWPSVSPYVTAVGGTDLETTGPGGAWASETAWIDGGGGYYDNSNFPIPAYQQLSGVINTANEGSTVYRNSPDVSANANWSFYVCADQTTCTANVYGGTSFAAPMWAGFLALVNQQAISNGNPTLGFINPAIYNIGVGPDYITDFNDVTVGSNGNPGYPAVTGFDLATGWGSPIGPALINDLAGQPQPNFTLSASPTSVAINQGNSGTSTITVNPLNGFSGSVTLTATGLPNGVTAGFNPNPATSTSLLTLTASASATVGTVSLSISGVSGSLTNTTSLSLTVNPVGGPGPAVTLSPTSLTFSTVAVGNTSTAKPVTVTNSGTTTLDISSIATTGAFGQAASTKPCGSTLAVGKNCKIEVTFTPTQVGANTGTLSISDNAANSPQTVSLSGTGSAAVTLTPASQTFPTTAVGTSSAAKVFTLSNQQNVALTGVTISTTGDFSVSTTTCGTSVNASSSCTINVVFTPTVMGAETGTLSVSDSASNSPQTSTLSGTGTVPATLAPASATYSSTADGTSSAAKVFTLKNQQSVALTGVTISTTGDFSVSATTCGTSVNASSSCTINVVFTPTVVGTETGTLSVSDSASNSPQTAALTGTGVVPAALTPATATYSATKVGSTSSAKVFTLKNQQNVALTGVTISTTGDFSVSTTTCGTSVNAASSCTINVVFTPTVVGTETGTLSVSDSALNSPQTASLTGTGK